MIAVLARELRERGALLLVAGLLGLLPLVAPLLPGAAGIPPGQARADIAWLLAAAVGLGTPLVVGLGILVRDIAQGRLSFYLTRPIGAIALWAGKLLAAWLLSLAATTLVLLPAALTGSLAPTNLRAVAISGVIVSLLLVLVGHLAASWINLRSPWLAIDLVLLTLAVGGVWLARRLASGGTGGFPYPGLHDQLLIGGLLVILLIASLAQVAVGRSDPRRSHGALSLAFWGLALPFTAVYVIVLMGGSPSGLERVSHVFPAPAGDWVGVVGPMRGGFRAFLLNTSTGGFLRFDNSSQVTFSPDGKVAAFTERAPMSLERPHRLVIARLDGGPARRVHASVRGEVPLALSPSGERVAMRDAGSLAVYDLKSGAVLASVKVDWARLAVTFPSEDVVRIFHSYGAVGTRIGPVPASEIRELDLRDRRLTTTGRLEPSAPSWYARASADGRFLVTVVDQSTLALHDGRSGTPLATLSSDLAKPSARFLTGGRIAVMGTSERQAVLRLHAEDGTLEREARLGGAALAIPLGEPVPGRLLVALGSDAPAYRLRRWRLQMVEDSTLRPLETIEGLSPLMPPAWTTTSSTGSPRTRFFLDANGALVRLDATTGRRTVVAP